MASLNETSFAKALKILYPYTMEENWFPEAPLLAWMHKTYDFEGESKQSNQIISGTRGSTSFAVAQAAKGAPTYTKFNVTLKNDYAFGSIDNRTMLVSRNKRGAVTTAIKSEIDAALYEFGRSVAFQAWGDGTGTRGIVSSYAASKITLTDRRDTVKFEVGMDFELKNTAAGGVILAGFGNITAIDQDAGTLTVTLTGMADPVANNIIARKGDYTAGAGNSNCLSGVLAWIPVAAPTATLFYGVDRTVYPTRLAGSRATGGGRPIEEQVLDALGRLRTSGGRADTLWLNSERLSELQKSMQAKAFVTVPSDGKAKVGFKGFEIMTGAGSVTCIDDPNCPYAYGLLTRREAWEMACVTEYPHFSEEDGRRFARENSSDGIEFRLKGYGNIICQRPIDNLLLDLDT